MFIRVALPTAIFGWVIAVAGMWCWTANYGLSTYQSPAQFGCRIWPQDTVLELANDRPTLLFFLHPRCPCSRASISELEKLLSESGLRDRPLPRLIVVATVPSRDSNEWHNTPTIAAVKRLPNSEVFWDIAGEQSHFFGAVTSGTVLVFAPDGRRLFAGGITMSRGHEGDNVGIQELRSALYSNSPSPTKPFPVFGCRLCISDCGKVCHEDVARSIGPSLGESK